MSFGRGHLNKNDHHIYIKINILNNWFIEPLIFLPKNILPILKNDLIIYDIIYNIIQVPNMI